MNNLKLLAKIFIKSGSIVLMLVFISSCMKEEINMDKISNSTEINGIVAFPILNGELTIKDIIESQDSLSMVKQYPDGLLYLLYRSDIFSKKAEDFVLMKDQSFVKVFNPADLGVTVFPPVPVPLPISITKRDTFYHDFGAVNGEEIDSIIIKSGTLSVNIRSTFHCTGNVKLTVPNLRKSNVPLQIIVPITVANGTFNFTTSPINLAGYKFSVLEKGNFNKVQIAYEVTLAAGGTILLGEALTFTSTVTNPKFSSLYGYIGTRQLFDEVDHIDMNVFDVEGQTSVEFSDPRIKIYSQNSFGVPLKVDFHDMKIKSAIDNLLYPLSFPAFVNFSSAESFTKPKLDTILFNKSNTGIVQAIAKVPKELHYGLLATVNPAGKVKNFITDTSMLKVAVEVELPMDLKSDKYELTDTIDFDLSSVLKDFSVLKSLGIYNKFENWFPFEAQFQLILTGDNFVAIDTLYTHDKQPIIKAGTLNTLGRIVTPKIYQDSVVFTGARILQFKNVKKAIMKVSVYTKDVDKGTFVKFYTTDKIKISLGIRAEIDAKSVDQF